MRKFPASPSLKRKVEQLSPKVEIVIACEGTVTEPQYFNDCVSHYGAGLVRLRVVERSGVPITVVRVAVEERNRLVEQARAGRRSGVPGVFRVWAVFDKDEHEVDEALCLARDNKVEVAFSNPCFELWPLLHLVEHYGSQDGRGAVQHHLQTLMPGYDHSKNPRINFEQIKDRFPQALRLASQLNRAREEEDCVNGCPSTTVGSLVNKIMQNGKYGFRLQARTEVD